MWNTVGRMKQDPEVTHDPLQSLSIWRSAIRDVHDQKVLDSVAQSLWQVPNPPGIHEDGTTTFQPSDNCNPNTSSSMDFDLAAAFSPLYRSHEPGHPCEHSGTVQACLFCPAFTDWGPTALDLDPNALHDSFQTEVDMLLSETAAHDNIGFGDFLNIHNFEDTTFPVNIGRLLDWEMVNQWGVTDHSSDLLDPMNLEAQTNLESTPQSFAFSSIGDVRSSDMMCSASLDATRPSQSEFSDTRPSAGLLQSPGHSSSSQGAEKALLTCLVGTLLFKVLVTFIKLERICPLERDFTANNAHTSTV